MLTNSLIVHMHMSNRFFWYILPNCQPVRFSSMLKQRSMSGHWIGREMCMQCWLYWHVLRNTGRIIVSKYDQWQSLYLLCLFEFVRAKCFLRRNAFEGCLQKRMQLVHFTSGYDNLTNSSTTNISANISVNSSANSSADNSLNGQFSMSKQSRW